MHSVTKREQVNFQISTLIMLCEKLLPQENIPNHVLLLCTKMHIATTLRIRYLSIQGCGLEKWCESKFSRRTWRHDGFKACTLLLAMWTSF